MHLSTHDQHTFYQRLGYRESTPVTAIRKCTVQFTDQDTVGGVTLEPENGVHSPHYQNII